ncbi:4-(cytidine 5'-diphospho)-2-C-methyl-D-erythritol kinase [Gaoshiqia sediminis]|uniref:4-diphosphocytidyl-2-C-methyl-D-erythritol kinase n=1 Tax=Gaoshiqia sediminis TaxID=2986998 RepID=A0AA42CB56_9BACT|nr:4-(cytidine 5'-diphospho)-2-C-methyl-D-erythritol kinase [Gaoshiqia sediminis]MCW0484787.1 4-(cytidine 5'-diphospho)-2-C-methyl-D-erythritol kinase [Gaoshiqia sediminis]
MITYPIAKINIGLHVTEKRPDGFHNLETIFYPIQMQDALEVVEAGDFSFNMTGLTLEGDPMQNLVIRAYELLKADYDLPPVQIHLHKNIPCGAGLGGGSSDAASMLMLLNDLFKLKIKREKLMEYALQLGSDCPFFLHAKPVFATGRGEKMEDANVNLKEYFLILVKPPIHISTPEAYQNIVPQKPRLSLKGLIGFSVNKWKGNIRNQFEPYVFEKYPEVGQIKQKLYDAGASFALMSGSGSAVYGLFRSEKRGLESQFPEDYQIFRQRL